MSLLLHFLAKLIFYAVLAVITLTLVTWFTRPKSKTDQSTPPRLGEWPEDKAAHVDRISAQSYSSSRRALQDEQEKRRA
jgi:hypothetical protein